jgi:hypothetical protein
MFFTGMEMQKAFGEFLARSGKTQRALEVFLYAMAFSASALGLATIVHIMEVVF